MAVSDVSVAWAKCEDNPANLYPVYVKNQWHLPANSPCMTARLKSNKAIIRRFESIQSVC